MTDGVPIGKAGKLVVVGRCAVGCKCCKGVTLFSQTIANHS